MKFNLNDRWLIGIISFVLASILFFFVAYDNSISFTPGEEGGNASYSSSEVIPNVPIEIRVDEEEYFVSGVPESVSVRLDGPQAVLTQTVITQNFNVTTPNLNSLGEGTHQISFEVEGLSDQIEYSLSPSEEIIEIEEKITEVYEPNVQFSESEFLASGYEVSNVEISQPTVEVTGAASTMEEISEVRIVAQPEETEATDDFTTEGDVVVLDDSGDPLNVNVESGQIDVHFEVEGSTSEIPIELEEAGAPEEGYNYELNTAEGEPNTIELLGDAEVIQEIDEYTIPVDVSGVTESTTRQVPILPQEGVSETNIDTIEVNIEVTEENDS